MTTTTAGEAQGALATKFSEFLESAFESVHLTRRQHFAENPSARPTPADVESIIRSYGNQNAVIAGAANLVPGPWGALTIVPEMTMVIRNQIQMIYDVGVAHGKEAHLDGNTLLAVFSSVLGGGAISLVTVRGGKLLLRRASLRVMQQVIEWLGGKIAQRVLKSFLARWVPIVGAGAMALWARQSTISMGREAAALLEKPIGREE